MRTGRRGARTVIGLAAALAFLAAACSKSSTNSATLTQPPATTQPPTTTQPTASSSANAVTVQQGAGGFVFAPAKFSVKKGEAITVTNVGSAAHTFTITGTGIDVVNSPGQSQSVTINLAPGTYQFICRFHVSFGMKGTVTVTG
jgi:plastocyanin